MKKLIGILTFILIAGCAQNLFVRDIEIPGDASLRQKALIGRHVSLQLMGSQFQQELAQQFPDMPRQVLDGLFFAGTKHKPSTQAIKIRVGIRSSKNEAKNIAPMMDFIANRVKMEIQYCLNHLGVELRLAQDKPEEGWALAEHSRSNNPLYLHETPVMVDGDIAGASVEYQEKIPSVAVHLTSLGRTKMAFATKKNIGKRLAVLINGVVITAPRIDQKIDTPSVWIMGSFSEEEARLIADAITDGRTTNQ